MSNNWNYVPFSDLFRWCQKSDIGSRQAIENGEYPLYIASATEIKKYTSWIESGEALIFGTGGNPCIHYVTGKYAYTNHTEAAKALSDNVYVKFYYYYFQKNRYSQLAGTFVGGGIKNSSKKKIGELLVPQLEKAEQERIVSRIEEMFSQLDDGVETLKKTKAQLTVYRQAVLKEAFDLGDSIKTVEISDIVDEIRIGPFGTMLHKEDYINGGVPVINPQHIKNNEIIANDKVSITEEKANELASYRLQKNDIVMGRRGEMGRCAPVSEAEEGWICGTGSIRFRLKQQFDASFFSQILSSPDVVHYLEEHATGTTMKNLNEEIVKHIPVPYMTADMQKKANENIEAKMSICDSIEQTVDLALQQAEAMRQSILKDAFEGRL